MKIRCPNLAKVVLLGAFIGALFLWVKWPQWGRCLMSGSYSEQDGNFGDFFGGFNALISVLGFGAVIYSLNKQQTQYAHDVKLRLFEKRVEVYNSLVNLREQYMHYNVDYMQSHEDLKRLSGHITFLFPNDTQIRTFIDELIINGYGLQTCEAQRRQIAVNNSQNMGESTLNSEVAKGHLQWLEKRDVPYIQSIFAKWILLDNI